MTNYAIEDLQQYFKQNLTILNEIIYATATVISSLFITYEENIFKQISIKDTKINREIQMKILIVLK